MLPEPNTMATEAPPVLPNNTSQISRRAHAHSPPKHGVQSQQGLPGLIGPVLAASGGGRSPDSEGCEASAVRRHAPDTPAPRAPAARPSRRARGHEGGAEARGSAAGAHGSIGTRARTHGDYRHALHVGTMPDSEQVRASPKRQYFVQSALCTLTQCWPPSQVIGGQLKSLHEAITSALPHHELQFRDQIHQLVSCLVSRRVCSVLCHQRQVG